VTAITAADGKLLGVLSDGDLRRLLEHRKDVLHLTAADCLTPNPVTITATELAASALRIMETRRITSLMVIDSTGRLEGVLHLHDLWSTGLV
jgi:arabinose-5-phosphate isomerase